LKEQEVREWMRHMGEYAIRTEEVPRFGVDTNVPDPAHTSDADDDAETEHGD
jgi:rRNA maturation protein Nop10